MALHPGRSRSLASLCFTKGEAFLRAASKLANTNSASKLTCRHKTAPRLARGAVLAGFVQLVSARAGAKSCARMRSILLGRLAEQVCSTDDFDFLHAKPSLPSSPRLVRGDVFTERGDRGDEFRFRFSGCGTHRILRSPSLPKKSVVDCAFRAH